MFAFVHKYFWRTAQEITCLMDVVSSNYFRRKMDINTCCLSRVVVHSVQKIVMLLDQIRYVSYAWIMRLSDD